MKLSDEGNDLSVATTAPITRERRAEGTTATGLTGRQRRSDDRRRMLVSDTLAAIRGAEKRAAARPLDRARAVLDRMRKS